MKKTIVLQTITAVLLATAGMAYADEDSEKALSSAVVNALDKVVSKAGAKQKPQPTLQQRNPRYQVQRGDVLTLDFPFTPEFNDTVPVQPDGYISLRGLGDIHVEGNTVPEINQSLREAYAKILHDPVITVTLKDFEKPYFIALGEVAKPGKYDLRGNTTVTQALAIAGGYTERAKHSQVLLIRRVSNQWLEVKNLDVKHMLRAKNLQEDWELRPGDMLFVPKNWLSKVEPYLPFNLLRIDVTKL